MCEREPVQPVEPVDGDPQFMLGPATRLLWRAPDSIHLEMGARAVLVEGLPVPLVRRVASRAALDPPEQLDAIDDTARHALSVLAEAGYLWPRAARDTDDGRVTPPVPHLAGELAALSARHGQHAAQVLDARRHAWVQVCGPARVGIQLAAILAASGVGQVHCTATGDAKLRHAQPGGVTPDDEGRPLAAAAQAAILRAAPGTSTSAPRLDDRPDLTILALDTPVPDDRRLALHAADAPHLVVAVSVDSGVVGPLVLPGLTSCVQCADLHRQDRDPAWAALAVQLCVDRRYGPTSDTALTAIIAGVAARQAIAYLDGEEPAALDATIEMHLPDWRLRRRSWPPHPDCDCSAEPA